VKCDQGRKNRGAAREGTHKDVPQGGWRNMTAKVPGPENLPLIIFQGKKEGQKRREGENHRVFEEKSRCVTLLRGRPLLGRRCPVR